MAGILSAQLSLAFVISISDQDLLEPVSAFRAFIKQRLSGAQGSEWKNEEGHSVRERRRARSGEPKGLSTHTHTHICAPPFLID